jgi:hypothetical protein
MNMNFSSLFRRGWVLLFILCVGAPKLLFADGVVLESFYGGWRPSEQVSQAAIIDYRDGMEKMILGVNLLETGAKEKVWIFPIPSSPEEIGLDVLKEMPSLEGYDIRERARKNLKFIKLFLFCTQIYPIPYLLEVLGEEQTLGIGEGPGSLHFPGLPPMGVEVREHIEKYGVTAELITAKDGNAIYSYFRKKGLKISRGAIPVLDEYVGKDYSFVTCWMTQKETIKKTSSKLPFETRGVLVIFPSQKIYYPLYPTSIYGGKIIPIIIQIIGYLAPPKFPSQLESFIDIRYIKGRYFGGFSSSLSQLFGLEERGVWGYTVLSINAPAKFLTKDLWMEKRIQGGINKFLFVSEHPFLFGLFLNFFLSIICAIISGLITLKECKNPLKLATIGIANFFTLIGVAYAIAFTKTRSIKEDGDELLEMEVRGYIWRRGFGFALLTFAAVILCVSMILIPTTLYNLIRVPEGITLDWSEVVFFPVLFLIIIGVIVFGIRLTGIKEEDRERFMQLKRAGYSIWTFRPKDRGKLYFVIVFSALYLLSVWLCVRLISGYF